MGLLVEARSQKPRDPAQLDEGVLGLCEEASVEVISIIIRDVMGIDVEDMRQPSSGPLYHGPYTPVSGGLIALGNEDMPGD